MKSATKSDIFWSGKSFLDWKLSKVLFRFERRSFRWNDASSCLFLSSLKLSDLLNSIEVRKISWEVNDVACELAKLFDEEDFWSFKSFFEFSNAIYIAWSLSFSFSVYLLCNSLFLSRKIEIMFMFFLFCFCLVFV